MENEQSQGLYDDATALDLPAKDSADLAQGVCGTGTVGRFGNGSTEDPTYAEIRAALAAALAKMKTVS